MPNSNKFLYSAFVESIVKTYMIKEIGETTDPTCMFGFSQQYSEQDTKLNAGGLASFSLWAVTESYIVIIGASIPTLGALFRNRKRFTIRQHNYEWENTEYFSSRAVVELSETQASVGWRQFVNSASDLGQQCTTSPEFLASNTSEARIEVLEIDHTGKSTTSIDSNIP